MGVRLMQRADKAGIILFTGFLVALTVTGVAFIWTPWPTNMAITGVAVVCYLWLYEHVMSWVDGE